MEKETLGVAIDIGTTTVALYLVDLKTGKKLATLGGMNAQAPYGDDVTSRIKYCAENGHEELTRLIREQISLMIKRVCLQADKNSEDIEYLSIAANTVMQHLVAGYSPVSMGTAPFTAHSLFGEELPAWDGLLIAENAKIYYTPAISAYVGGDITAGLLAARLEQIQEAALFLDIGTNGEIVLKHNGTYYCCATAAGPAFEGAGIEKGMIAESGAIKQVKRIAPPPSAEVTPPDDPNFSQVQAVGETYFTIIGGGLPLGICGSGLLDTIAILLEAGVIDKSGRMFGGDKYWLTPSCDRGVYVSAADIRKLQLAKAAIAAGIQVLLHFAGITEKDVKILALSGGFGNYMDLENAAHIGMFPKRMLPIAETAGNTAGEGAVLALTSDKARTQLEKIKEHCEYIELSSMTFFNDKYIEEMAFDI